MELLIIPSDCVVELFWKPKVRRRTFFALCWRRVILLKRYGLAEVPWCFCWATASLCCLCAFTTEVRAYVRAYVTGRLGQTSWEVLTRARALSVAITHETQLSPRLCGRQTCYSRILLFYYMQYSKLNLNWPVIVILIYHRLIYHPYCIRKRKKVLRYIKCRLLAAFWRVLWSKSQVPVPLLHISV